MQTFVMGILLISSMSHAIVMNGRFSLLKYERSEELEYHYDCQHYSSVIVSDNSTYVTEVQGRQEAGKQMSDVGFLTVWDVKTFEELPKGIDKFFPKLSSFSWISGSLKRISSDDLKPFPNLIYISFSGNQIHTLDGDLFKYTRKLIEINFSSASIEQIGCSLLDGLDNLIKAVFSKNKCINSYATNEKQMVELKNLIKPFCVPSTSDEVCADGCLQVIANLEKTFSHKITELENQMQHMSPKSCSCSCF